MRLHCAVPIRSTEFFSEDTVANRHFEIIPNAAHTGNNTKGQMTVAWNSEQDRQCTVA